MSEDGHILNYNSANLSRKDPFCIKEIKLLEEFNIGSYYESLVSAFIQQVLVHSDGFNSYSHHGLGGICYSEYFFYNQQLPALKQWTVNKDETSGRFKKGDNCIATKDTNLEKRISNLFGVLQEIENYNYEDTHETEFGCKLKLRVSDSEGMCNLEYYESKDTQRHYFIFEFNSKKEQKKVVRSLVKGG